MARDAQQEALADAKRAQLDYERNLDAARKARRKSFEGAQKTGLSLRDIGDAVGLHRGRVWEILRGK
jgi:DNA-directed RNA polymerase specialized sigma24 family protein